MFSWFHKNWFEYVYDIKFVYFIKACFNLKSFGYQIGNCIYSFIWVAES